MLILIFDEALKVEEEVQRVLSMYHGKLRSKIVKNGMVELTIEIQMKVENGNITYDLSTIEGMHEVTFVECRGNYEI